MARNAWSGMNGAQPRTSSAAVVPADTAVAMQGGDAAAAAGSKAAADSPPAGGDAPKRGVLCSLVAYMLGHAATAGVASLPALVLLPVELSGPDDGILANLGFYLWYNPFTVLMIFIGMYYVLRNMMGPMFPAFTVKQGIFYIFVVWVDIFFTYTVSVSIVGEGNVSYSYLLLWCAIIGLPFIPVYMAHVPKDKRSKEVFMVILGAFNMFFVASYVATAFILSLAFFRTGPLAFLMAVAIIPTMQLGLVRFIRWEGIRSMKAAKLPIPSEGIATDLFAQLFGAMLLTLMALVPDGWTTSVNAFTAVGMALAPFPMTIGRHVLLWRASKRAPDAAGFRDSLYEQFVRRSSDHSASLFAPIGAFVLSTWIINSVNQRHYYVMECLSSEHLPAIAVYCACQFVGDVLAILFEMELLRRLDPALPAVALAAFRDGKAKLGRARWFLMSGVLAYVVSCLFLKHDGIGLIGDLLPCEVASAGG